MSDSILLSADHISKTFVSRKGWFSKTQGPSVTAVKDFSLRIGSGERVAFIGPNGAGKSTSIRILCGLLIPTSGTASVCGLIPWKDRNKLSYSIGCVFGNRSSLWHGVAVRDSFRLLRDIYSISEDLFRTRLDSCTELFEIEKFLLKDPKELSLGERMKCEITASLLHGPKLLFLDEPSIGLDIEARLKLRELIRTACSSHGITVLLTSHDTGDIEGVCDRVVVINHGCLIFDSSMRDLRQRFLNEKTITLHTGSKANLVSLPGTSVRSHTLNQICVEVDTTVTCVEAVVTALLRENQDVSDILVEERPFEEVIRNLYKLRGAA